ncbi:MAG: flagellar export protein FliJ [Gemmatimonadetes bacterium]|nr:flagellar export protein FliJ [Gemmatimonadota bacterium]
MAKKFRWRLNTVKKAKERHEDQKQQALGEAQTSQNAEERVMDELQVQRQAQQDRLKSTQSGKLNPIDLQAAHAYISDLTQKIEAQQERVEAARAITQSRRNDLVKAVQENKVLENLRTRDHEAFRKDERKREQAETDEVANRAAHRRQQQDESES